MSMCRVFSCVVGRGCLLWPVHFLGKILLIFALLHSIFQGQNACYPRCFLTSYFCIPTFASWKGHLFWVLVLKGLVSLHRTIQLQLLQHYSLGHRLGYRNIERSGNVILNGLPWKRTEIILSFLRLHPSTAFRTLVDHVSYSISSNGFMPTVVDVMVTWVKFTHSSPF